MLEETFPGLAGLEFFNNSAFAWIFALGGAFLVYTLVYGALRFVGRKVAHRAHAQELTAAAVIGGVLGATRGTLIFIVVFAGALRTLVFPATALKILAVVAFAAAGIQVALWLSTLVMIVIHRTYSQDGKPKANTVIIDLLIRAAQLVIWSIILIVVLDNAGVNVTTFIASLGIGGMAVAFAMQKILADLFASIAIGLDKPFEVGHFISFGSHSGTVERVGIKTSHIRTISGERLVVSNSALTDEVVTNVSAMQDRGVTFTIKVAYGTSPKQVRGLLDGVESIVTDVEGVQFGSVHLTAFADSGLEFVIVYRVISPEFGVYRAVHQQISLEIMDLLERLDVDFAIPTRKVRVTKPEDALHA